jgi:arylsulfatase A-like enzyme
MKSQESSRLHSTNAPAETARKPNLLFVFTDQQSRDMLGCYGNADIKTPCLDAFAADSIRFDHCISSSPVCTPYRGMLLTGQHPLRNGAVHNDLPLLANNGTTFAQALGAAGYRTAYVGKWHLLGHDRDRPVPPGAMRHGFDETFLSNNCHMDYRPGHCYYWNERGEKVFFDEWEVDGQTRQAVDFLKSCEVGDPFALFVSWHPPHDVGFDPSTLTFDYGTEQELMDLYDPATINLRPSAEDTPDVRRAYHGYYAMCSGIDRAFGRLIDALKARGLYDNTLIVFTSDHGDNLHSYGYTISKDHPEDTSVRVPFLVHLPGEGSARTSNLLVGTLDLMPTLLGLLGVAVPKTCQGRDLSHAILQQDDDTVDSVPLFFHQPSWNGVYTREHTYGRGELQHWRRDDDGNAELHTVPVRALYTRADDPSQLQNLYGDPAHAVLQERLERVTRQWMEHFGDPGGIDLDALRDRYRMPDGRWPEDTQEEGFPGLPIEVIRRPLA